MGLFGSFGPSGGLFGESGLPDSVFVIHPRERFATHEEFVRANSGRPGVVANGASLVDLYDRIVALEARVRELESGSGRA